ncbi:BCLAF1 and THRAP3 family member 3 isoform X1 [Gambusia affinis]|uniref:BCLAF1 and THRAP3 family member 3 isoform X1 n=2 Tax=Gambusia affinis TaxID=33528 RepID=UPI001CDD543B|nr:BCLAF1 and THRAP3 family member 3 isoform X1 [Gambusia affinis]
MILNDFTKMQETDKVKLKPKKTCRARHFSSLGLAPNNGTLPNVQSREKSRTMHMGPTDERTTGVFQRARKMTLTISVSIAPRDVENMSRPRSRSPHYRRFPWEEPDFDPRKVIAELDVNPQDRGRHPREGPDDFRGPYRADRYRDDPRRSPYRDEPHFRHQRHPDHDEFDHWGASPHRDDMRFENRRFSPRDEWFDDRGNGPPPLLPGLSPNPRSDQQQRKMGPGWRREEVGRDQGGFRGFSPGMRADLEKGGRFPQQQNRHYDRNSHFKRPQRQTDAANHPGFREEEEDEDFGGRGSSVDRPRGGFRGRSRGSFPRFARDFGMEADGNRFDYDASFERPPSPPEHFRREDGARRPHFHEDSREPGHQEPNRRSPDSHSYGNHGNQRWRGRGRYNHGPRGRTGPHRHQLRYADSPQAEQRHDYPPFRDDEPGWEDRDAPSPWRRSRSQSLDPNERPERPPPPPAKRGWNEPQNDGMAAVTEETLTIKVDMSRPVNKSSALCYSSDRQLSLDLVNVGRQRLDFLPLLEHSGTYRENAAHSGTFAQEIITLVHFVKEQYFRGDGVTLTERFSAPQKGGYTEDELEELTLHQRFSSNRGFSLNMDSILDDEDDEPLFFRQMKEESKQPQRGPGDLRHDLERRRQEKLEAVKVTIEGSSFSQHSQHSQCEPDLTPPMDPDGFWPAEQNRRRDGGMGSRRGAFHRPNMATQRRNNQFGNQRQNLHSNPAGPNW